MAKEIIIRALRVEVQDETVSQGRVKTLNFEGSAVAAAVSVDGETATVTITPGANALNDLTDVTISSPSAGQVLRKGAGTTDWANSALAHADLGTVTADQHHNQSHILANTASLGTDHTATGLTAGQVLRASGTATAVFAVLDHADLGNVTTDQHHAQSHAATSSADHTFPSGTANFLRADGTFAAPPGGADPWTHIVLAAAFTTNSATAQVVTGLGFTPAANTKYEIFGQFYVQSAATSQGPRLGWAWPTGLTNGVGRSVLASAISSQRLGFGNADSTFVSSSGVITSTAMWPAYTEAVIDAGATPSGSLQVVFSSSGAGTTVTMAANSFIRYRTYT